MQESLDENRRQQDQREAEIDRLESENRSLQRQIEQIPEPPGRQPLARALSAELSLDLYFRPDSAELEPFYARRLNAVAGLLQAFPELELEIRAHADRTGEQRYNQARSERRMQRVFEALRQAGVGADRLQGEALGEQYPVTAEGDREVYGIDRRVEIRVTLGQP